jgi:D-alanyl-D-alanine carboxypeptidase (penicillin-binding protein 5/6)
MDKKNLTLNAKASILVNMNSGKILFEKQANVRLPIASLTKIMTLVIILDKIDDHSIKWTDTVTPSLYAVSMMGSKINFQVGEELSVEDMFKGIIMASGNDAAIAMAEHVSGSVDKFVKAMNNKALQLQLSNTHFINPHGLPNNNHYSSAFDIAKMSMELIKRPDVIKYSNLPFDYIMIGENRKRIFNTNTLIRIAPEVDGLKTGYTPAAGYCLAATASFQENRLVAVVLGEPDRSLRNIETLELLRWGYSFYKTSENNYTE